MLFDGCGGDDDDDEGGGNGHFSDIQNGGDGLVSRVFSRVFFFYFKIYDIRNVLQRQQ